MFVVAPLIPSLAQEAAEAGEMKAGHSSAVSAASCEMPLAFESGRLPAGEPLNRARAQKKGALLSPSSNAEDMEFKRRSQLESSLRDLRVISALSALSLLPFECGGAVLG